MKCDAKRKGFTLVELLIVIVVIGILSAMMMMSSSEAVSSSKASNITSNLRNLQTAALAYWADNMNKFNKAVPTDIPVWNDVLKYLKDDQTYSEIATTGYSLVGASDKNDANAFASGWYIKYTFVGGDDARVKEKVAGRATSLGLLAAAADNAAVYTNDGSAVYLKVR